MILIVESGSTKADWILIDSDGVKCSFKTKGWNIMLLEKEEMLFRLDQLTELNPFISVVKSVHFYTPGVSIDSAVVSLEQILRNKFCNANVIVESDLLAAARSVYKGSPVFVSILGTGSNTAFYDGEELEQTSPSLGYILGDEGSGASLGKELLKAYLYKTLPEDLYFEFSKFYSISKESVLKSVYTQEAPNRFLASYVPFLVANKNHVFVQSLVRKQFDSYIQTHLKSILVSSDYSIAFVGSVAFFFQDILIDLCMEYALNISDFNQSPLKGLINYHSIN
jgi:N-acetylglucosamine kinase-like BadF-type ATPase